MDGSSIRRAAVFAVLFGGAVGGLVWFAGGPRPKARDAGPAVAETPAVAGPVAPIGRDLSVGVSEDGELRRDDTKVLGDATVRYRAWTAVWKKATPVESADPEVGVQNLEEPKVVLFPEPTATARGTVPEGAPGTARVTARSGVLRHQKDLRTSARLTGGVLLERFDDGGDDLTFRSELLELSLEKPGTRQTTRRAQTTEPVAIDGGRAHLEGTGLDADLSGEDVRVTLLAKVKGRFIASGGFGAQGGRPDGAESPVDVTCSGSCELVSLDTKERAADRRWRATFRDDVKVSQEGASLTCDVLEVEFRANAPRDKSRLPADRVVATGHVVVRGLKDAYGYGITCGKATRSRQGNVGSEVDLVVYEGSPVFTVDGLIGTAKKTKPDPASGAKERLEIRCNGPVTMQSQRAGAQPTSPYRTSVEFKDDVVARRFLDVTSGKIVSEVKAPVMHLYGTRLADGRFQPDTMTAENGVDLFHDDGRATFTSHSGTATWARLLDFGIDRHMLSVDPVVRYRGVTALDAFGGAEAKSEDTFVLSSKDNVTIDVFDDRPDAPGAPPRPYAKLTAGPQAKLVQYDRDDELAILTAAQLEATVARNRRLEIVQATGGAHVWGRGADGRQTDVYGSRIVLAELVMPPGAPPGARNPVRITASGEGATPAVAILRENDGRVHDVRAGQIVYDGGNDTVTASRDVVANLSGKPKADDRKTGAPTVTVGSVCIRAAETRVSLRKSAGADDQRKLRRVEASGGVTIDAGTSTATGREADYDAVTGIAEIRGPSQTACLKDKSESPRFTNALFSDLIRVYLDVTSEDPKLAGQVVRASCPGGGRMHRFIEPPGVDGKPLPGTEPRRVRVESAGPIEATRTEATLTGDVAADVVALGAGGEFDVPVLRVYCDRAHVTYDADAPGGAAGRIRTLDAVGLSGRQITAESPEFRAYADRADVDFGASTARLSTTSEKEVWFRSLGPGGEQAMFETGVYHYRTKEWTDQERFRAIQEPPPERR